MPVPTFPSIAQKVLFAALTISSNLGLAAQSTPAAQVPTYLLQAKPLGGSYQLDGVVQPVKQATVAAQTNGRIASLLVKAGDHVRSGQVLATIDDREALVGLQRGQGQVNQAEAEMRNAKSNFERTRDLQSKGFVSKAALDSAQEQFNAAQAAQVQAVAGARQASLEHGFTRVTAPFDGWVMQTLSDAGDLAVPGHPILSLYAPQPLRVVVQVPASRTQAIKTSRKTSILLDDPQKGQTRIVPISKTALPSADPVTQTTEWRFELSTKDATSLVPGQQVRMEFAQSDQDAGAGKLVIPGSALVQRGELNAVYVANSNGFSLRAVRLGATLPGDTLEVVAGVAPGEFIALDPIRAAYRDAMPLKPTK